MAERIRRRNAFKQELVSPGGVGNRPTLLRGRELKAAAPCLDAPPTIRKRRVETAGEFADGLAGYLNTFLSLIMRYRCFARPRVSAGEALQPHIYEMLVLHERAALLARSLAVFSSKHVIHPVRVSLNEVVTRASRLIGGIVGEHVELRLLLGREDLKVMADPVQIEQALMNLATNARDAMTQGGALTIKTGAFWVKNRVPNGVDDASDWKCAFITVSDTGIGIDEKAQRKIFEPFYTTKETGKGVGLGLAIVAGIIKQHNGSIRVSSEPGKGAAFTLYLPLLNRKNCSH